MYPGLQRISGLRSLITAATLKKIEESPGVESLAKLLHDIAASASILLGKMACRGPKLTLAIPSPPMQVHAVDGPHKVASKRKFLI